MVFVIENKARKYCLWIAAVDAPGTVRSCRGGDGGLQEFPLQTGPFGLTGNLEKKPERMYACDCSCPDLVKFVANLV